MATDPDSALSPKKRKEKEGLENTFFPEKEKEGQKRKREGLILNGAIVEFICLTLNREFRHFGQIYAKTFDPVNFSECWPCLFVIQVFNHTKGPHRDHTKGPHVQEHLTQAP